MDNKISTEQPLILQPQCVDCRFYDGFGACTKYGYQLRDNCEDFADMKTIHKYVEDMENYEEKYKQAIEMAKEELKVCGSQDCDAARQIFRFFPELKKNDDERIRKEIIGFLKDFEKDHYRSVNFNSWIAWLEKQGKQLTDKVEPKFKVGDWVILNGVAAKILDKQEYGFVGLDIDGKDFFCNYGHTDLMRLWTINDAKDGDVLVNSKGNPFIFTGKFTTNYHNPIAYCGIGNKNKFIVCVLNWRFHWAEKKEVAPATQEQRDLLFKKMKEAGYEWNNEKKELKKIEVASKESEDERIRKGIIRNLQYLMDKSEGFVKEDLRERIAWLEKQGDTNETINKDDFAQGVLKGAAINLITWIDYNAAEGNMCLSNMECKDIEDALVSGDWGKIYAYIKKKLEKQGEQSIEPKWCHHKVDLSNCSEEYRKAYYDGWNNCNMQHSQCRVESNNMDEKIRKELIEFIKSRGGFKQEYITWLERQESVGEIVERCKTSWYNEGKIDGQIEGLSDDEKYQQGWHDALEKQGEQKQSWKPSIAQKIVIKELIEDKNTSNVHKTILRGMLDEFKQFTNNCKRETDNYETEDSSQT